MTGPLARVWVAALALGMGAALGADRSLSWVAAIACTAGVSSIFRRRHPRVVTTGVALLAFGLGLVGAAVRSDRAAPLRELTSEVPRCEVSGRILETAGGLGTIAAIDVASCGDHPVIADAGVVVLNGQVGAAGERLTATGWLLPLGDDGFERARARLGADALLDVSDMDLAPPPPGPHSAAGAIRRSLIDATDVMDADDAALARGLAIGDTEGIDPATLESFRRAGLTHLVAVSGSNVAIVVGAVAVLARSLSLVMRTGLCAGALALFVLVVGPDASVLRAAAMGAIALVALAGGRGVHPLHLVALAVMVVIGVRPAMVSSVGLHLSVAATLGIVLWATRLDRRCGRIPRLIRTPLAVTIAAQIAVLPIIVGAFGQLSLVAPLANLAAVPAVAPATVLTLAGGVVGLVAPPLGRALAIGAEPFAAWILFVGERTGSWSWAAVEVPTGLAWPLGVPLLVAAWRTAVRPLPRV